MTVKFILFLSIVFGLCDFITAARCYASVVLHVEIRSVRPPVRQACGYFCETENLQLQLVQATRYIESVACTFARNK